LVPGRGAVFAPDGSLLTFGNGVPTIIYRTTGLPFAAKTTEIQPSELVDVTAAVSAVPLADGTGLATNRVIVHDNAANEYLPSSLLWDGTVVDRDASVALVDDGLSFRRSGANGQTIASGCDTTGGAGGGCRTTWNLPDGTETPLKLPAGVSLSMSIWTPDGATLIFTSGADLYTIRGSDQKVTKLASLPTEAETILGITDDLVLVQGTDSIETVGLDGAVGATPIPGTFIRSVP
jgi:hypothetical protein